MPSTRSATPHVVGRRNPFIPILAIVAVVAGVLALIIWSRRPPPPPTQPKVSGEVPPARVRVVIDASASMAGYFNGKTEFKDFLAQLIPGLPKYLSLNQKPPEMSYAFAGAPPQLLTPYEGSTQTLISDILNNKIPAGGSSMLQDVLGEIKNTIRSDEVDFLLTDGIFSYSNAEIKKKPDINKINIEGLAALVQEVFQHQDWGEKKIKPGLAILQYLSHFQGTYFTFNNTRLACCDGPRPFYLWIIGDAKRVASTFAAIRQIPDLEPRHAVLLGQTSLKPDPRVLNYSNRSGTWIRGRKNRLTLQQVPARGPAQVTIALNLSDLPADVLKEDYVLKHLDIKADFATLAAKGFWTRAQAESKLNARDVEDLNLATHFLVLDIKTMELETASVSVALRDDLPPWSQESTTDDDMATNDPEAKPQTFGFLPIVKGAFRALHGNEPLLQFQLTLER